VLAEALSGDVFHRAAAQFTRAVPACGAALLRWLAVLDIGARAQLFRPLGIGLVEALFAQMEQALGGAPEVVVYNPSFRVRGALIDLDPVKVAESLAVSVTFSFQPVNATPALFHVTVPFSCGASAVIVP
jgi:hypothetical protein